MTKRGRANSARRSDMKTDNYRRKDYVVPRSIREAYGYDETFEPEVRCCSELFYKTRREKETELFIPFYLSVAAIALFIWWLL